MRYLQLVHNTWDPVARVTKAKVLHSFGREDEVNRLGDGQQGQQRGRWGRGHGPSRWRSVA